MDEIKKDICALYDITRQQGQAIAKADQSYDLFLKMHDEVRADVKYIISRNDKMQEELFARLDLLSAQNYEKEKQNNAECKQKHEEVEKFNAQILNKIEEKFVDLQVRWAEQFSSFKKYMLEKLENKVLSWKVYLFLGIITAFMSAASFLATKVFAK